MTKTKLDDLLVELRKSILDLIVGINLFRGILSEVEEIVGKERS